MTITVLDTYPAMRRILRAPAEDRVAPLQSMLEPVTGMYRYFPGEVDLVAMHRMAFGFPLDRDEARCLEALETLAAAGAWDRMRDALDAALAVQLAATPALEVPDITVLVVLGDPGDAHRRALRTRSPASSTATSSATPGSVCRTCTTTRCSPRWCPAWT